MGMILGGERCWKKYRAQGGLAVYFEWFEGEPAMFVARSAQSALSGNRGSAAIAQRSAHLYADSKSGAPTPRLLMFAAQACHELGMEPSRTNIRRIADAIVDGLPDLVRMPPEPSQFEKEDLAKSEPVGDIALVEKSTGRVIEERTLH